MLNRNNLTLSALSNRLNLGTRSLVLQASVDNGKALRIRHAHQDVMRETMAAHFFVGEPLVAAYPAPPITGPSTPVTPRLRAWSDPTPTVDDASSEPLRSWRGWPCRPVASLGACSAPSSRLRRSAAASAAGRAVATKPRPDGRGVGKVEKAGAAGAASRRTVGFAAIAATAGS
jgi:hypothetical protein